LKIRKKSNLNAYRINLTEAPNNYLNKSNTKKNIQKCEYNIIGSDLSGNKIINMQLNKIQIHPDKNFI
jgi:hypothetical protein